MQKKQAEPEIDPGNMCDEELRQWLTDKYPGRKVERDGDEIVVTIPVNFHRRNGRQMISATGAPKEEVGRGESKLSVAFARALQWQLELESGDFSTIEEMALAKTIDVSYMRRMLRLSSLAPDIVESILNDVGPDQVSLRTLFRGIDPAWSEQRRKLGIA